MLSSRFEKLAFLLLLNCAFYVQVWSKKEPCTDYPSCQLISEEMFENYCSRSTLKNMCPTHCDKSCQQPQQQQQTNESRQSDNEDDTEQQQQQQQQEEEMSQTQPEAQSKTEEYIVSSSSSSSGGDDDEELVGAVEVTTTTTSTTTTSNRRLSSGAAGQHEGGGGVPMNRKKTQQQHGGNKQHRRPGHKKIATTTTFATTTTTTSASSDEEETSAAAVEGGDYDTAPPTTTTLAAETTTSWPSPPPPPPSRTGHKFMKQQTTTKQSLHTELPDSSSETTRKVPSNLPNGYYSTIYVPLFEAGFVQRVIPTSSKEGYDFGKAKVCKKLDDCAAANVWCPLSNDIPKEQLEVLLNYTTDIYMLETQGAVFSNETVTSFLFQYLNEAGMLVSRLFRTETSNSTEISKFKFEPPFRTNYIRITPIDFFKSIMFRFEIYSKGILYNPSSD